jgi:hypothetical protein
MIDHIALVSIDLEKGLHCFSDQNPMHPKELLMVNTGANAAGQFFVS